MADSASARTHRAHMFLFSNRFWGAHAGSTLNPYNGDVLADVAAAQSKDVDAAVAAARQAFDAGTWPRMTGKVVLPGAAPRDVKCCAFRSQPAVRLMKHAYRCGNMHLILCAPRHDSGESRQTAQVGKQDARLLAGTRTPGEHGTEPCSPLSKLLVASGQHEACLPLA